MRKIYKNEDTILKEVTAFQKSVYFLIGISTTF